ncbi:MAG: TlpA family protein disulfide reductase [Pseudomonadales bacterium]|nr:TlpA family protein disulfide reductase [Pseudomonadales bacterium]
MSLVHSGTQKPNKTYSTMSWSVLGKTLGMLFGLVFGLLSGQVFAEDSFSSFGVDIPKTRLEAPAFTLADLQNNNVGLSHYKGKVVLLNFWATWCEPCREEMPSMQRLWDRYREQGFVIVAVAADKGGSKPVISFVEKLALDYPILVDPKGDVRNRYEVVGLPMSYLIARDGKMSGRIIGIRDWDSPEADAVVTRLLAQ